MIFEGLDAVQYLNGHGSVRDGALVDLAIRGISSSPTIELIFEVPTKAGPRVLKLELRDVLEFSYSYLSENPPVVIEFVKCLATEAGDFYLSLDPYDEREAFISEKDNEFFRSRIAKLTV